MARIILFIFCLLFSHPALAKQPPVSPEALAAVRLKAENGDLAAIMSLAETYYYCRKQGVPCDKREALKWYLKAAEHGNAEATFRAGNMYYYAGKVSKNRDYKKGVELWRKAAELGHTHAQLALGNFYSFSTDIPPDYTEAFKWYSAVAKNSDTSASGVFAQESLASMYLRGEGVEKNDAEALRLFHDAASKGGVVSLGALCTMYERGEHVVSTRLC